MLASPGRAALTTTLPLTVSTDSLRPATPLMATLALTLSTFTPARAGTDTSITLGPLRPPSPPQPNQPPPPDGLRTSMRRSSAVPSTSSFSTPSPSVPVMPTSARSQVRTTMRPFTLSMDTVPSADRGRTWWMGVAARAGRLAVTRSAVHQTVRVIMECSFRTYI